MFTALVVFFGSDKGGRIAPPLSGYHPQIQVGDIYTSCIIESCGDFSIFEFEREYEVSLQLHFPHEYGHLLHIGSDVRLFEGSKLVGRGIIIGKH